MKDKVFLALLDLTRECEFKGARELPGFDVSILDRAMDLCRKESDYVEKDEEFASEWDVKWRK